MLGIDLGKIGELLGRPKNSLLFATSRKPHMPLEFTPCKTPDRRTDRHQTDGERWLMLKGQNFASTSSD